MGNPAGRRVSRPAPWMARGGGPRIQACVRAHRAQARCRVVGQEPFGYFGALFQSDPPSGGTPSSRYRSNGYVHNPAVSPVRPPSRASPLPQLDCGVSGREVSAGRPSSQASQLPQLDRGVSGREVSVGRPSSQASQLPQLDRVVSGREVSVGRPSSQASQLPQLDRGVSGREVAAGRPLSQASQLPH